MTNAFFNVKFDNNPIIMGRQILKQLFVNRIKHNFPCVIFLTGKSGVGKSLTGLKIQQIVDEAFGLSLSSYFEIQTIFTPFEHATKLNAILHDKLYKKVHIIQIDEARDVLPAEKWQSILPQLVADVNAQSRAVKPLVILIISQSSKDILKRVKPTLTYYINVDRALRGKAHLKIYDLWSNDYDINNIITKKRRVWGFTYKVDEQGKRYDTHKVFLNDVAVNLPPKAIVKRYNFLSAQSKALLIEKKLNKFLKTIQKDYEGSVSKIEAIVDFYASHPNNLDNIIKQRRGTQFSLIDEFGAIHDLNIQEVKIFKQQLMLELQRRKVLKINSEENEIDGI